MHLAVRLLLLGFVPLVGSAVRSQGEILAQSSLTSDQLVAQTNSARQAVGAPDVRLSPELTKAAEAKLQVMKESGHWGHQEVGSGSYVWSRIDAANYDYRLAGENLARGYSEASKVVDAWMASELHRANLLNPEFKDVGFAIGEMTIDGISQQVVVQIFGTRR